MTQFDSSKLPPPILTSEPGSFAGRTFEVRIPHIVEDTIAKEGFPPEIARALRALRTEILDGVIQPLGPAPDKAFWDELSRPYYGRSWLDVPWYWAESYFYRRVLEATGYFQPGAWHRRDPYSKQKSAELQPDKGSYALQALLSQLPQSPEERFLVLLYASLWGNRVDLSYNVDNGAPGSLMVERERANLLVDDARQVWNHLLARRGGDVAFVCDNAGTELLHDLALAHCLLDEKLAGRVTLHLKPQPYFVSDAMIPDAQAAIAALAGSKVPVLRKLGEGLTLAEAQGRLVLADHWAWASCLFFFQLPAELEASIASASVVVCKGDANYRRLLGDAHWDPAAPFAEAVSYLAAPVVALRTLKSEIIVGLRPGETERLRALDPKWQVDGQRGLVQFKP